MTFMQEHCLMLHLSFLHATLSLQSRAASFDDLLH